MAMQDSTPQRSVPAPQDPWATAIHHAARPLIALATQLRSAVPDRPKATAAALVTAVETFERELARDGCDARTVTAASYLLCVWLDEVMAPHAWAAADWPANSLLLKYHDEADGHTRVFRLLDRLMQQPQADRPLLELFHTCLSLGLQGHWRDATDGPRQLAELRKRLAALLQLDAEPLALPLSVHWQPAVAERRPGRGPRLVVAGLTLLALAGLGVYTGSQWALARQADEVFASLQGLERASRADGPATSGGAGGSSAAAGMTAMTPAQAQAQARAQASSQVPGQASALPPTITAGSAAGSVAGPAAASAAPQPVPGRLAAALAGDLAADPTGVGLRVHDELHRSLVVLGADGLFVPDTTLLNESGRPRLERIAQALASTGGRVLVTAFARSDTARPVRVPSASQLADEWARRVAQVLEPRLPKGSVSSEGRVPSDDGPAGSRDVARSDPGPLADARRNRVEITLYP